MLQLAKYHKDTIQEKVESQVNKILRYNIMMKLRYILFGFWVVIVSKESSVEESFIQIF